MLEGLYNINSIEAKFLQVKIDFTHNGQVHEKKKIYHEL